MKKIISIRSFGILGLIIIIASNFFSCKPNEKVKADLIMPNDFKQDHGFRKKFHIEVDDQNGIMQYFYNLNIDDLKKPIILKKRIFIEGMISNAQNLLEKSFINIDNDENLFIDILVLPIEDIFLTIDKPNPIKTRIRRNGSFKIELLSDKNYLVILNPKGALDQPPHFLYIENLKDNLIYNFSIDYNNKIITSKINEDNFKNLKNMEKDIFAGIFLGDFLISSEAKLDDNGEFKISLSNTIDQIPTKNLPKVLNIYTKNNQLSFLKLTKKLNSEKLNGSDKIWEINFNALKDSIDLNLDIIADKNEPLDEASVYLYTKRDEVKIIQKKIFEKLKIETLKNIFPGQYDIAIIPNKNSKYGLTIIKDQKIDKNSNNISINLNKKHLLKAYIKNYLGQNISKASIKIFRIGKAFDFATEDILFDFIKEENLLSDEAGEIMAYLDEGKYEALVTASQNNENALFWVAFDIPSTDVSFVSPKPFLLQGQILMDDEKSPCKMAFVTIYADGIESSLEAKKIGQMITDENGFFKIMVYVQ